MAVMGDALRERLSDAGSIPARSIRRQTMSAAFLSTVNGNIQMPEIRKIKGRRLKAVTFKIIVK